MNKEIKDDLDKYIADTFMLYVKWHNIHWNVVGLNFKEVHEYTKILYNEISKIFDETAKLMKKNDEYPAASIIEYQHFTSVKGLISKDRSVNEALMLIIGDLGCLISFAKEIISKANKENKDDVVNMLKKHIKEYKKFILNLKKMSE